MCIAHARAYVCSVFICTLTRRVFTPPVFPSPPVTRGRARKHRRRPRIPPQAGGGGGAVVHIIIIILLCDII